MQANYTMNSRGVDELRTLIGTPAELLQQYYGIVPTHGKVRCPFHADKTPSMKVYADNVHCFGCGWHGDSLDIYAKANNLTLQEAIRYLRHQAGDAGERWRKKVLEAKRRRQIEAKVHEEADACFRSIRRLLHGIEKMLPRFQITDAENEARQNALYTLLLMRQAAEEVLPVFYSGDRLQEVAGLRAAKGAGLWP
jgi:DNA primase